MPVVFWNSQWELLTHFQKRGENVNCVSYGEVLLKLRDAENVRDSWQEGYCFIMTMPDPKEPEQPGREFKTYSGNFLNVLLTA
jgi:hypothetical protein